MMFFGLAQQNPAGGPKAFLTLEKARALQVSQSFVNTEFDAAKSALVLVRPEYKFLKLIGIIFKQQDESGNGNRLGDPRVFGSKRFEMGRFNKSPIRPPFPFCEFFRKLRLALHHPIPVGGSNLDHIPNIRNAPQVAMKFGFGEFPEPCQFHSFFSGIHPQPVFLQSVDHGGFKIVERQKIRGLFLVHESIGMIAVEETGGFLAVPDFFRQRKILNRNGLSILGNGKSPGRNRRPVMPVQIQKGIPFEAPNDKRRDAMVALNHMKQGMAPEEHGRVLHVRAHGLPTSGQRNEKLPVACTLAAM